MIQRNRAPLTQQIDKIDFICPKEIWINPHVKFLWMEQVPNQTSRIDLYFDAGLRKDRNIVASICSALLLSGTNQKTSTQIHSQLDELGSYFDIGLSHEGILISVFALKTNLLESVEILYDAIQNVIFPEKEINEMINERREKHKINEKKVSFLSQRKFQEKIFYDTPYSELTNLKDYDQISRNDLINFHKQNIKKGLYKIALVGSLEEKEINSLIHLFKGNCVKKKLTYFSDFSNQPGVFTVPMDSALQSALRVGKTMFNKSHTDFYDFSILNTVLGDYFGSRLMKNIREDKGYTYGIGSALVETGASGYFIIGSEVGIEHIQPTLTEIKKEMDLLCEKEMGANELDIVKNYLFGQMLKSADGPYAMMDLFLSVDAYMLNIDFYNHYITRIHEITPEDLRNMANKYLKWDSMSVVHTI